jgi:antitoxin component YwqK of YwqJK toxin-antitoxin module
MMKNILYILLLVPFLSVAQENLNQTDANGLRQGLWKRNYPNGRMMYEGFFTNDKPVGEWKRYHENGALRAILVHSENSDSVSAQLFDIAGKPAAEGTYINEQKAGKWQYFSVGRKISEEEFDNGVKSGVSRIYYPSGELLEESEWKNDQKEGRYRAFYQTGKPFLECTYENNLRNGFCVTYFPSGAMEVDAFYQNDLPHGEWKYYTENEELRFTLIYDEGALLNPEVLYEQETKQLDELERKGKSIADPEKFMHNPMEYLLKNQ